MTTVWEYWARPESEFMREVLEAVGKYPKEVGADKDVQDGVPLVYFVGPRASVGKVSKKLVNRYKLELVPWNIKGDCYCLYVRRLPA